jgi:hypothetical protein
MTDEKEFPKVDGDPWFASEHNSAAGMIYSITTGENISAGNLVYIRKDNGQAYKADTGAANDCRWDGFALETITSGNDLNIQINGAMSGLSGLTAGTFYYMGAAGALTATANNFPVGVAISTTVINVMQHLNQSYLPGKMIGDVWGWHKTLAGVPQVIPSCVALMDGSTISDAESPMNGETLRDLNGNNEFLRGGDASAGTGGSADHCHQWHQSGATGNILSNSDANRGASWDSDGSTTKQFPNSHLQNGTWYTKDTDGTPPYMDVVMVIKIK